MASSSDFSRISLWLFILANMASLSLGMRFHHSNYKVHHQMGKMKIKVKPEGAKLIFSGGDLDVEMHPAHGYVRPVHNVIVNHHENHHENYHEEPIHHEIEHDMHHEDDDDHSGHHEYHHDDHYEHGEHGHHGDSDGYGFGHFHHFPDVGHGHGHAGLLEDGFFHGHHEHGHFRDEIRDPDDHEGLKRGENAASRQEIIEMRHYGSEADQDSNDAPAVSRDKTITEEILSEHRSDAKLYGKNIFPEDISTTPTHKSNIETRISDFTHKIVPSEAKEIEEEEEGSAPGRTRSTLSPFDDENDNGGDEEDKEHVPVKYHREEQHERRFGDGFKDAHEDRPRFREAERQEHEPRYQETGEHEPERSRDTDAVRANNRHSEEHSPKIDTKRLEKIANSIPPNIPNEQEMLEERENNHNTKDIGSPNNIFVNMSGEPHNYGEENNEQSLPSRNTELDPDIDSSEHHAGDYYPNDERKEVNNGREDFNELETEDREQEHERRNINEFRLRSQRRVKLANEAARKKDFSPPLVVHPGGDPRERGLKKAFYEYNPTYKQSKHLASITDFSVRSNIADKKASSFDLSMIKRSMIAKKRRFMVDRLIERLKNNW